MYESLNTRAITVGSLLVWVGIFLGFALLAASQFTVGSDLGRWGIAVICVTCTYSLHRALVAHDDRMLNAFKAGRDYEQLHSLTSVR